MSLNYTRIVAILLFTTGLASACPDFGVGLRSGEQDFAYGAQVRATATGFTIFSGKKTYYAFAYVIENGTGHWCFESPTIENGRQQCVASTPSSKHEYGMWQRWYPEGDVLKIQDDSRRWVGTVVLHRKTSAGRAEFHGLLYRRFVLDYGFTTAKLADPDDENGKATILPNTTNDNQKWFFPEGEPRNEMQYQLRHTLTATLVEERDGEVRSFGKLTLTRTEHPFEVMRSLAEYRDEADLSLGDYETEPDSHGCQSRVRLKR